MSYGPGFIQSLFDNRDIDLSNPVYTQLAAVLNQTSFSFTESAFSCNYFTLSGIRKFARTGLLDGPYSYHQTPLPKEERKKRVLAMAERVGLSAEHLKRRPHELSGGQRQALTLLMATLVTPKLLLLDEHTAALDPKTALKVLTLSAKIVEENHLTTMMITHNMKDAIAHGNRLIMMMEGKIILDIQGEEKKN